MSVSLNQAIKRIKLYAFAVAGLNRHQLAARAGLTEGATRNIHEENWNPELSTLLALEAIIPADWDFEETPIILTNPKAKGTTHVQAPGKRRRSHNKK